MGRDLEGFLRTSVKGLVGETAVMVAAKLLLPSDYSMFHNVTLRTPDGTTQIDHVFVSRFGVFVVETKNMGGWIYGSERNRRWTQVFPGGRKESFQNPLRQNYRHVKAIETTLAPLELPADAVRSVVAFVGDAKLKTEMPDNVTVGIGFIRHIKSFTQPKLSDRQLGAALEAIKSGRLPASWSTHREHARHLRARADPGAPRKCPRCGKDMVLRTTKRGPNAGARFWGCSGFPACRAVQEATGSE